MIAKLSFKKNGLSWKTLLNGRVCKFILKSSYPISDDFFQSPKSFPAIFHFLPHLTFQISISKNPSPFQLYELLDWNALHGHLLRHLTDDEEVRLLGDKAGDLAQNWRSEPLNKVIQRGDVLSSLNPDVVKEKRELKSAVLKLLTVLGKWCEYSMWRKNMFITTKIYFICEIIMLIITRFFIHTHINLISGFTVYIEY